MTDDNSLELDRSPTAEEESREFSTPDERADLRNKNHEIELLKQQQGPVGRLIGCSDSALNIAFTLLIIGGLAIAVCCIGLIWHPEVFETIIERLITFELTVAGYVMGKKASED